MPRYTKQFSRPTYVDHKILNADCSVFGTIRVKPVSILWKGANKKSFKSVSVEAFAEWISQQGADCNR